MLLLFLFLHLRTFSFGQVCEKVFYYAFIHAPSSPQLPSSILCVVFLSKMILLFFYPLFLCLCPCFNVFMQHNRNSLFLRGKK